MATIALYANKINQMPGLTQNVKKSVVDYQSELSALKKQSLKINQSICNLDDVVNSIQASSQTQEQKIASLETFQQNSEQFIEETARIDSEVADVINQRKDDFYEEYNYLKPECEKNGWEKFCDGCKKVGEWCKEHWKLIVTIVVVAVAVVALVVITVVTAGAALGPILTIVVGVCKGIITGAIIGGLMGGMSSVADGESFWAGFEDGAFSGMIAGAVFGGIGGGFQALGNSCNVLSKLGLATKGLKGLEYTNKGLKTLKIVSTIANISGYASLGMFGFDFLAKGAGVIWGKDNAFTAFNTKLHESSVYNSIQLITGITALASGGFAKGMKNPVCFVAGTLVLTPLGLVAIEKIKAGDKVISTNTETFEVAEKKVLETYIRETKELVHLTISGELIKTTYDHLFYVKGYGFVSAGELYIGDKLLDSNGNVLIVENRKVETFDEVVNVYNFQVEAFHTYHVSENGILVHNAGIEYEGGSGIDFDLSKLSRSQQKAIESADNIINDHLESSDLSAALGDLQGNPIAKPNGGYWNHAQEVKDAYTGLVRAEKTLAGSLQNPNLAPDVRAFIQGKYDTISNYISIIEDMFAPYGGIN